MERYINIFNYIWDEVEISSVEQAPDLTSITINKLLANEWEENYPEFYMKFHAMSNTFTAYFNIEYAWLGSIVFTAERNTEKSTL